MIAKAQMVPDPTLNPTNREYMAVEVLFYAWWIASRHHLNWTN
jgi:hypothetical protein